MFLSRKFDPVIDQEVLNSIDKLLGIGYKGQFRLHFVLTVYVGLFTWPSLTLNSMNRSRCRAFHPDRFYTYWKIY